MIILDIDFIRAGVKVMPIYQYLLRRIYRHQSKFNDGVTPIEIEEMKGFDKGTAKIAYKKIMRDELVDTIGGKLWVNDDGFRKIGES